MTLKAAEQTRPVLACKQTRFWSAGDERAFFSWIKQIPCVEGTEGVRDEIWLRLSSPQISDECLRELLALFHRYKIDMKQLEQFATGSNQKWFRDDQRAYWWKHVFGTRIAGRNR